MPGARRRFLGLALLALLLLVAGCKVDTTVSVNVHDDGSGVVSVHVALDADAVAAAEANGGKLEQRVRLSDLSAAGWTVGAWQRAPGGSATLDLSKPFTEVAQVGGIVKELSGAGGPLRDVRVTRDDKLLSTDFSVTGQVDLKDLTTGVSSDQQLVQSLTTQHVDVNAIDQQLLAEVRQSFALRLEAQLPGGKRVSVAPAAGAEQQLDASTSVRNDDRILYGAAAIGFVLLAIVVMLNGRRLKRRRRRRRAARRGTTPETA
jgi:hypothetical protein